MNRSDQSQQILEKAAVWMSRRGWKRKLAKRRGYEQTLFEHSLLGLDVLTALLPILRRPQHYGLSEEEQKTLVGAVLVHDLPKETDPWQAYVRAAKPDVWVPHVLPELTRAVVPELCAALGYGELSESVQRVIAQCAEFHHSRPGRSDGEILEAMLTGGSDRFLTLAHLVRAVDHVCSAASIGEAREAVEGDAALGHHLIVRQHEAAVRGVSTAFLHRAAQTAFERRNWIPLLYFSSGTLYGADPNDRPVVPTPEEIRELLTTGLAEAMARDVAPLMVGSPTGNILPKPDLLAFAESKRYLRSAAEKISPLSFARKRLADKRRVCEQYRRLRGEGGILTDEEVERTAARISVAQPEMLVFKFFKALMNPEKVGAVGTDGAAWAKRRYEEKFGSGSWSALQSTSTLMPALDMARTVDYFWALPGQAVDHPEVENVGELPDRTRLETLTDLLDGIAQGVFAAVGRPSPRDALSTAMAGAFLRDLLVPEATGDVRAFAEEQLTHYVRSKPFAGKESAKGIYFCPMCNAPFGAESAKTASADFIDKPQTHTNRGVAHGSFGYVVVCMTCYFERLILQILLGRPPAQMITLLPRLNLGPMKGDALVRKVREWVEAAKDQMRGEDGNPEQGFSLGLTEQIARRLGERDPFGVDPGELLSLFSYRFTGDTQKKRKRAAIKRLEEEFDNDLRMLNDACGHSFSTWEAAAEALIENRIGQPEFRAIRREVLHLHETVNLICQTPNLVFIPLGYEVAAAKDESESSKGLRRLYVALMLGVVFDASVAVHKQGDPVDFRGGVGVAYVPPVPSVRSLVEHGWVPITEARRWLDAIGAASLLARDSGLPVRSALYQILGSDPAEKIARRIEEAGVRSLTLRHLRLIAQLPGFRSGQGKEARG